LTTPSGDNVPARWVPFTRPGCDVGAFLTANIVLERSPFDVQQVPRRIFEFTQACMRVVNTFRAGPDSM
jgi:hypothetical protein